MREIVARRGKQVIDKKWPGQMSIEASLSMGTSDVPASVGNCNVEEQGLLDACNASSLATVVSGSIGDGVGTGCVGEEFAEGSAALVGVAMEDRSDGHAVEVSCLGEVLSLNTPVEIGALALVGSVESVCGHGGLRRGDGCH